MTRPGTTKLVISVRSPDEAQMALEAGADVIDVKEPSRGSLGAADAQTLQAIIRRVAARAPLSAALGELCEAQQTGGGDAQPPVVPADLSLAKFGLAGCGKLVDWQGRWERALGRFPREVAAVGVVYADWPAACAPPPRQVIESAQRFGCRVVLVDTYKKVGRGLLDHWTLDEVGTLIETCRDRGLQVALAGSLTLETLADVLPLAPDYVAVRGAACEGQRSGVICSRRVQQLSDVVRCASPWKNTARR